MPRYVLRIVQAVLEHDQVSTGPLLTWSPVACGRATPVGDQDHDQQDEAEDELVRRGWALPNVVRAHGDYADDVALDVALAAAEERFTERAFGDWLWRWLDLNYGIPRTDDNVRQYHHRVWSLRQALAHPQLHPQLVRHPAVDRALAHTSRRQDGQVEPWRLP